MVSAVLVEDQDNAWPHDVLYPWGILSHQANEAINQSDRPHANHQKDTVLIGASNGPPFLAPSQQIPEIAEADHLAHAVVNVGELVLGEDCDTAAVGSLHTPTVKEKPCKVLILVLFHTPWRYLEQRVNEEIEKHHDVANAHEHILLKQVLFVGLGVIVDGGLLLKAFVEGQVLVQNVDV